MEKSPEFTGSYNDTLCVHTKRGTVSFFLPDFGIQSKTETLAFTDMMVQYWKDAQTRKEMRSLL